MPGCRRRDLDRCKLRDDASLQPSLLRSLSLSLCGRLKRAVSVIAFHLTSTHHSTQSDHTKATETDDGRHGCTQHSLTLLVGR